MKKIYLIFLSLLIVFTTCKKSTDENNNNNTGWTEEDQTFYNNVITLQDKAYENYTTWSQTMDSLETINKLQQFFLSDPTVSSATIGSQGIAVQYSNGMRGGIFLYPENREQRDKPVLTSLPKTTSSGLNEKSLVNNKNLLLINPIYWSLINETNDLISKYNASLPKVGFSLLPICKNSEATVDRFTQLTGKGIIHIYSHGFAWPEQKNIEEVYVLTGERVNDNTTKKYGEEIKSGEIPLIISKESYIGGLTKYWVSPKFITSFNDFSKDTVLFYGAFCYSRLGGWDQIYKKFAKGTYFGFNWAVDATFSQDLAISLIDSLCDTLARPPYNPEKWITGLIPEKEYYIEKYNRFVTINYVGDATLTLWKDSAQVVTNPITDITSTTATGGGNIKSDGGFPITERGVCWSTSQNPTVSDSKTIDGSGIGSFTSNITGLTVNILYYVRAYATNSKGTIYGNEVNFKTVIVETVTDIDGNVYHTITIGTQVWMVENLKTTKLNDGTPIPLVVADTDWYPKITPGYCWYNNDIAYKNTYGALYNWYIISTGQLAPIGWHVPTDAEWTTLSTYLGGESGAGGKLKETGTTHWKSPNEGATNETGFTALPGGIRDYEESFCCNGEEGFWWSSSESGSDYAWSLGMYNDFYGVVSYDIDKYIGLSVRCIKD